MINLTIIVPYHNRAKLFHRMLSSVIACKDISTTLILVDNNSTDESSSLAAQFAQNHSTESSLKIICTTCNKLGASAARNVGANQAQSEWIYFFDSDDELSADFLLRLSQTIRQNPNTELIGMNVTQVFEDGTKKARKIYYTSSLSDQILTSQYVTQTFVIRRSFYDKIGGWNEQLIQWNDWEFCLRMLIHKPNISWLPGPPMHRIYIHSNSITGSNFGSSYKAQLTAMSAVRQILQATFLSCHATRSNSEALFALAARWSILSGHLQREGFKTEAEDAIRHAQCVLADVCNNANLNHPTIKKNFCLLSGRLLLSTLRWLTSFGCPGTWLLARWAVRII